MATSGDDTQDLGSLFESITGQTSITETQHVDVSIRLENLAEEQTVSEYLARNVQPDGLEDAIDEPNRSG